MDRIDVIREWVVSLGILTAVVVSQEEAEMKLGTYVPLLAREFDAAAFTADSLAHVAADAIKGFPTYGELVASLRVWWRDHRPTPPALPSPPGPSPCAAELATEEERAYVRARVAELEAHLNANRQDALTTGPRPAYLSAGVLDAINPLPNGRKRAPAT